MNQLSQRRLTDPLKVSCSDLLLLQSRLRLVLSLRGYKEVIENILQEFKSRPVLRFLLPALHHDLIEFVGAAVRTRHPVRPVQAPDHLRVGHPWLGGKKIVMDFLLNSLLKEIILQHIILKHFTYLGRVFFHRWLSLWGGSQRTKRPIWCWRCQSWWPLEPSTLLET